jgi:hypothetical protein
MHRDRPHPVAVVLAVVALVAGCASSVPTATPVVTTPNASPAPPLTRDPSPTSASATHTPSPTAPPSPDPGASQDTADLGLPVIVAPPGAVHSMPPRSWMASWGPHVYGVESADGGIGVVHVDVSRGRTTTTAVRPNALIARYGFDPPYGFADVPTILATDGRWLALVVWRRLGPRVEPGSVPCVGDEDQPIEWRLLVAPLDPKDGEVAGAFTLLDQGTNRQLFDLPAQGEGCVGPRTPRVSVSDGRIAYTREDSRAGHPVASRIVVRALPGGAIVRQLRRPDQVVYVRLSGDSLAFTESDNGGQNPRWAVRVSTAAHPDPVEIVAGAAYPNFLAPPIIALDDDLLAWQVPSAVEQGVWASRLGSAPQRLPTGGLACLLGGVTSGWIGLGCLATEVGPGDARPVFAALWSASTGLRQLTGLPADTIDAEPGIAGGWLVASGVSTVGHARALFGVRLDALRTVP